MKPDNIMTSVTIGVTAALFIVWMQRHQRWAYFINGLTGRYIIIGSRAGAGGSGGPLPVPGQSTTPAAKPSTPAGGAPVTPVPAQGSGSQRFLT